MTHTLLVYRRMLYQAGIALNLRFLEVHIPHSPGPMQVADERESIKRIARETPRDPRAEEAFLASKAHLAQTHPKLDRAERELAFEELTQRIGRARLDEALEKESDVIIVIGRLIRKVWSLYPDPAAMT